MMNLSEQEQITIRIALEAAQRVLRAGGMSDEVVAIGLREEATDLAKASDDEPRLCTEYRNGTKYVFVC